MGILKPHIHILCFEQEKRPVIKGDVLTLGQQAVFSTLDEARSIISSYKGLHGGGRDLPAGFDTIHKIDRWKNTYRDKYTNAQSVLTLLGADHVFVADVSSYEKPDFIIDLNVPVPDTYQDKFDTILDVGTLEHVFDIAVAFDNVSRMLKKGGNLVLILPSSNAIDHGFYSFSPTLFYDYFGANGFTNMACYLREGSPFLYERKSRLYRYNGVRGELPLVSAKSVEVAFIATKEREYGLEKVTKPIQSIYRESQHWTTGVEESQPAGRARIIDLIKRAVHFVRNLLPPFLEEFAYSIYKGRNRKSLTYLGKF